MTPESTDDNIWIALEGIEDMTGETSILIPIGAQVGRHYLAHEAPTSHPRRLSILA